jgi:hypothetical protein
LTRSKHPAPHKGKSGEQAFPELSHHHHTFRLVPEGIAPSCGRTAPRGYSGTDCRFASQRRGVPGSEQYPSDNHLQCRYAACPLPSCVLSLETGYRHTARGYNLQVRGRVRTVGDGKFPNRWHRVTNIGQCWKCCAKFGHSPRSSVPRSSFQSRQMFTFGRTRRRAPYNTAHIGAREQTSAAERR